MKYSLSRLRYLIYSEDYGVYLGSCLGLGFWSKLDPAGQNHAVLFDSREEIEEFINSWDGGPPPNWRAVPIMTDGRSGYASTMECVAAGLPGWVA